MAKSAREVLKAIAEGVAHSKKTILGMGDTWGPREEIIAQFAAAHTARLLTQKDEKKKCSSPVGDATCENCGFAVEDH
jgi:hypothetical protein